MDEKQVMAERLRTLRRKHNKTQQEIADYLHISQSAYAFYETATKEPKIDTLKRLAELYNTSIDYLVGRY